MDTLLSDLRYAGRTLIKAPGFTAVAVLTLALGIGVNTTVFSCMNALMLRPFPYRDPERLVALREENAKQGWTANEVSYPNFVDWRAQSRSFTDVAAYTGRAYNVSMGTEPEYLQGTGVSAGMFGVLGVKPILGRDFRPEEDVRNGPHVVLISHALWERRFAADPQAVGGVLRLNGEPHTIIGVMPPRFQFPAVSLLWTPLQLDPVASRRAHYLETVARLKPGVTIAQAQSDLLPITRRLEELYPESNTGWSASVVSLRDDQLPGEVRTVILIMMGAVGFVLLIACANIANLLLARAMGRQREIAIRTALGAGRLRIVRQLLTESVLVSMLGALLGIVLARWGLALIVTQILEELPFWMQFTIDGRALTFTIVVAVATGIIFGLAPAWQGSRPQLAETLRESGRGTSAGRRRQRLRSGLVVAEVALSLVLLIGATLMIKSFLALQRVDPGFRTNNVLAMRLYLGGSKYDSLYQRRAFFQQLLPSIRALPGVEAVSAINNPPLGGSNNSSSFLVEGRPVRVGDEPSAAWRATTPEHLATLRIPLRQGRFFTDQEMADSARVAVINETMVQRFWPAENPIGKRLRFGTAVDTAPSWYTVIGVAGDIKQRRLNSAPENQFYVPYTQGAWRTMTLLVRTRRDPAQATAAVVRALRAVDPNLPASRVMTMDAMFRRSVWQPRLYGMMFGSFALIALVLSAVGVYGVIAYSVSQRTHEIGVRMALGARAADVLRLVVGHGLALAVAGVAIGLVGAFAVTRLLSGLLFGVSATDPVIFTSLSLFLSAIAVVASYVPARRAARVDPLVAMRTE